MRVSRVHSITFIFVLTLAFSLPLGASHDAAAQTDCSLPLTSARVENNWTADCQSHSRQNSYARYYTFTLTEQAVITITLESDTDRTSSCWTTLRISSLRTTTLTQTLATTIRESRERLIPATIP